MWTVVFHPAAEEELAKLSVADRVAVLHATEKLAALGPRSWSKGDAVKVSQLKAHGEVIRDNLADPDFAGEWDRTALARAVAERIVTYRAEHGLSQTGLARLLRMQQPAIARLESGEHTPSLDTLWRLASRLGVEFHIDITARGVAI